MFPSILNTFNRPTPTDRLNSPSHSALHNTVSSALGQVEAVIGTNSGVNASAVGTLMYDVRSPNSNGGGHVQTANKGGTGQTTFTKGDLFVATSTSVISKLAVGTDGQVLQANTAVAAGIQWAAAPGASKVATNASVVTVINTVAETSILSVTIAGSTLGINNAIRAKLFINDIHCGAAASVLVRANYGSNAIGSVMYVFTGGDTAINRGTIECNLIANNSSVLQRSFLNTYLQRTPTERIILTNPFSSIMGGITYTPGTSSVSSSADATLGVTVRWSSLDADNRMDVAGYIVEKIS